jgi:hypothetical protein
MSRGQEELTTCTQGAWELLFEAILSGFRFGQMAYSGKVVDLRSLLDQKCNHQFYDQPWHVVPFGNLGDVTLPRQKVDHLFPPCAYCLP